MKLEKKINTISKQFMPEERETSILYDYVDKVVHLETTEPFTARRWSKLVGKEGVKYNRRTDSFKITVPMDFCRKPELILMAKYR